MNSVSASRRGSHIRKPPRPVRNVPRAKRGGTGDGDGDVDDAIEKSVQYVSPIFVEDDGDASPDAVADAIDASPDVVADAIDASSPDVVADAIDASSPDVVADAIDASPDAVADEGDASTIVVADDGDASPNAAVSPKQTPRVKLTSRIQMKKIVDKPRPRPSASRQRPRASRRPNVDKKTSRPKRTNRIQTKRSVDKPRPRPSASRPPRKQLARRQEEYTVVEVVSHKPWDGWLGPVSSQFRTRSPHSNVLYKFRLRYSGARVFEDEFERYAFVLEDPVGRQYLRRHGLLKPADAERHRDDLETTLAPTVINIEDSGENANADDTDMGDANADAHVIV